MKREHLKHYLLVFDHMKGKLMSEPMEFEDASEATAAYSAVEQQYVKDDLIEVVLIGSDSIDTVRATHANYFDGTVALIRLLERVLQSATEGVKLAD